MPKKKKKKNGKLKTNGNVGGKADVHLSSNGSRNKSLLGHNAIFTPEVIDDVITAFKNTFEDLRNDGYL